MVEEVTPWGPSNAVKMKTLGQLHLKVPCGRIVHEHVFRVIDQQDDVILGLDIQPAIGISVAEFRLSSLKRNAKLRMYKKISAERAAS